MSNKSEIKLNIELGEDKVPAKIEWYASDSPMEKPEECSAMLVSLWDGNKKEDRNVHLWTKKMTIEEMNHFYFRSMMMMADSYQRATGNEEEANKFREYAKGMGTRNKVIKLNPTTT